MPTRTPTIGESLRHWRLQRELSLAVVAEQAGVSVATLSRVETNNQTIDVGLLLTLSRILDVAPAQLLGGTGAEDERTDLVNRLSRMKPAERTRLFLQSSRRRDSKELTVVVDDLLSTVDVLRDELLNVQRAVRRGKR